MHTEAVPMVRAHGGMVKCLSGARCDLWGTPPLPLTHPWGPSCCPILPPRQVQNVLPLDRTPVTPLPPPAPPPPCRPATLPRGVSVPHGGGAAAGVRAPHACPCPRMPPATPASTKTQTPLAWHALCTVLCGELLPSPLPCLPHLPYPAGPPCPPHRPWLVQRRARRPAARVPAQAAGGGAAAAGPAGAWRRGGAARRVAGAPRGGGGGPGGGWGMGGRSGGGRRRQG